MNPPLRPFALAAVIAIVLALAGCVTAPVTPSMPPPAAQSVLRSLRLDPALEDRILALDPDRITEEDVRTLAAGPAPRIVLLHGGIFPVYLSMVSFGRFLVDMGYPDTRIRDPGDRRWSYSPYQDSTQIAGLIAWAFERDGLRPMLIGHSQGGIQVVKVLRELDGAFRDRIAVWDPIRDGPEERTTIVDPLTGAVRPVVGLSVSYASSVGAGGPALLLPNHWSMLGDMWSIPDTVDEFTGYSIGLDFFAWSVPGGEPEFRHNGKARVRNVALPAWYNHVTVPATWDLAKDPAARPWISAYVPGGPNPPVPLEDSGASVLWAADVWHSVKRHWCLEVQRLIRARRAVFGAS